ncbi:MAG: hypothetical protein HOI53_04935 [Francisellaceae bacterium]|jgi:hypothetical protein|nr:hypothetical protein [Francisellaceae bacterium]MBT6207350.1 hypothetical protein [Francisellaceae bacterium]MBT6538115.1 hypothetical protein [Francisellaceae bacterium]
MNKIKYFTFVLLSLCHGYAYAGLSQTSTSLSAVTDSVGYSAGILGNLLNATCIIMGVALIASAVTQYQIHKNSPKLVPLTTPIVYVVLSLCVLAIPATSVILNINESEYGPSEYIIAPGASNLDEEIG